MRVAAPNRRHRHKGESRVRLRFFGSGEPGMVVARGGVVSPNSVDPRRTAPYRLYFWSNENIDTHKSAMCTWNPATGSPSSGWPR